MPCRLHLALLLALTLPAAAQQAIPPIDDPANLMGERVAPQALADELPIDHGAPALEQLLRKLRTRASLMLIVAHPDDEDSGMLTYESRGQGARVAMLTLTRGEGGQNLMSADFNDALGLIRTQELLAEDRYTGTDQFFGTEVDFGFSKTKEESFRKWTHDRVLYDAVRAVRLYRPLVLASVFIGGVTDGHGQHQVAGEIAQEVFLAAADPKVFPEMGLPPWAPLRVYARVPFARITAEGMFDYATGKYLPPSFHNYVTGQDTTTPPVATVTILEGEVPAIPAFNGMSYAQWARQGLALQKTQIGPNFHPPTSGSNDSGYTLYGSRADSTAPVSEIGQGFSPANQAPGKDGASAPGTSPDSNQDLFTGIDTSLVGLTSLAPNASPNVKVVLRANLGALDNSIAEAQREFDPSHPEMTASTLRSALGSYDLFLKNVEEMNPTILPANEKFNLLHELRIKRVQLNNSLMLALGVTVEATLEPVNGTKHEGLSPDTSFGVRVSLTSNGRQSISYSDMETDVIGRKLAGIIGVDDCCVVEAGRKSKTDLKAKLDRSVPATRPYFTREGIEQPFYNVDNPSLQNAPETPSPVVVKVHLNSDGVPFEASAVVSTPTGENAGGPTRAAVIVPAFSLEVVPSLLVVPRTSKSFLLQQNVTPFMPSASYYETVPAGWKVHPHPQANPPNEIGWTSDLYEVEHRQKKPVVVPYSVKSLDGRTFSEGYHAVGYPGITTTNVFTLATAKIVPVDVTTAPNLRIAYLPGTGDDVPQFLPSLGVTPTILAVKHLTAETLKQYDAVVVGVRAYSAHPELAGAASDALTAYAKQGGVVIVQYNSAGFNPASAPYPYTVPGDSAHNVVEEEHPVAILQPQNPLLTWPNRITPADFDHWIEERGHGFASDWAPEYTPLLEMHDDGQDPQKGGLLVAKVGKGAYIYCALALYRQLPEGVPGAYRLFANLLSYAKNPGR